MKILYPLFLSVAASLASFSMSSCKLHPLDNSATNAYSPKKVVSQTNSTFVLKNLRAALESAGIIYSSVVKSASLEVLSSGPDNPRDATNLSFSFGMLDEKTCEIVKKVYADGAKEGLSGVDCKRDANKRNFSLIDFLSPLMQATIRQGFIPEATYYDDRPLTPEEKQKNKITEPPGTLIHKAVLFPNCWSTAYELGRRNAKTFTVHVISDGDASKIFNSDKYTAFLNAPGKVPSDALMAWLDKNPSRYGDILILSNADGIVHAATFIDQGLLFELVSGASKEYPYRVSELKDIMSAYPRAQFDVRRVLQDFPHISQIGASFSSEYPSDNAMLMKTDIAWRDVQLLSDPVSLLAKLPPDAFQTTLPLKK